VGKKEDLFKKELFVSNVNWLAGSEPELPASFQVKIRYRHQPAAAEIMAPEGSLYPVCFTEPQMAITPGQFAVFYNDNEVIGGGEIV
jgi:tRNA-specific 2-thiouridylase